MWKGSDLWCPHENDWPVTPPTLLNVVVVVAADFLVVVIFSKNVVLVFDLDLVFLFYFCFLFSYAISVKLLVLYSEESNTVPALLSHKTLSCKTMILPRILPKIPTTIAPSF